MKRFPCPLVCLVLVCISGFDAARAAVVFEATSPYHHIRVIDQDGTRTLSFDQSQETRMSLTNPLAGHFEYTEYFHMPWLWQPEMKNVLMIGLGGGTIQRAYQHFYPDVNVDTVELDPMVVQIAQNYFAVKESPTLHVHILDGRLYLRRTAKKYDVLIMDAYKASRYGSFIPYHLVTKEFFELARDHLTENGVVAYNVIGTLRGWRADILGGVYKTMKSVFPQVYLFPANDSWNIVLLATKKAEPSTLPMLRQRAAELVSRGRVTLPTFQNRLSVFQAVTPTTSVRAQVLIDDFAPVDGLLARAPSSAERRPVRRSSDTNTPPSKPGEEAKPAGLP